MDEYIELINSLRQEAEFEAYLQPHSANETPKLLSKAADVIEKLSGERKKGKWKEYNFPVLGKRKYCSACGFIKSGSDERIYNFCPRCGADCRKEET